MRKNVGKKCEQAAVADIVSGGDHQYRNNFFGDDCFAYAGDQVLNRNCAFAEELFHQLVIAFGYKFDQLFVGFFRVFGERGGNFFNLRFSIAIGSVEVCLHRNEIDHPAKSAFRTDRQLQRDHATAKGLLQRFHGALETCQFAVHPCKHERARNIVFQAEVPIFLCGYLCANVCVDGDQCRIGGDQGSLGFVDEGAVTGEIEEINFYI